MKRKNAGFTLLELVVVVAVMGLISTMAMDVYTDHSNQKRFDATKERLAEIKFAIIGDPMMRVGSQPIIAGAFFKDMKTIPTSISELLVPQTSLEGCLNKTTLRIDTSKLETACTGLAEQWLTDIEREWKGPYISNRQTDSNGNLVFKDGWGNNFHFAVDSVSADITIISRGLDGIPNPHSPADYSNLSDYEKDYPRSLSATPQTPPEPFITSNEFSALKVIEDSLTTGVYCVQKSTKEIDLNKTSSNCESSTPVGDWIWVAFKP